MLVHDDKWTDIEQQLMQMDFSSKSKVKDSLKERLLARMEGSLSLEELDSVVAAGSPWAAKKQEK